MIKLLHLSDIHLGSGFAHGRLNPETGLNTRLEDFVAALSRCMDRALAEPVDLVLFGGDAFPDATPPPLVQQALAQQFCRLSAAGIPAVLLVGNHDQHAQGLGGASLSIYRTLGVPDVVVGDRLETHRIHTRSGPVQIVTLPWLTRSTLLTRPDTEGLSMAQVNELLLDRLRVALEGKFVVSILRFPAFCWPMPWSIPPATGPNVFCRRAGGSRCRWRCWRVPVLTMWRSAMSTVTRCCANSR